MKPRILVIDIETSPIEAYVWGLWEQNVGLDFIKTEWTILSYAAQWLGERAVMYADCGGHGAYRVRDDKGITICIRELLDEADIVVAQNGKRFDVRKINARMAMHGLSPPSPYRVIDTLIECQKYFAFTSHKLAWTSKYLTNAPKSEHKRFPGFELWKECLLDNPKAWAEMKKYNIQDIKATVKVYLRVRPWMNNHPNVTIYDDLAKGGCPNCGGKVHSNGKRFTQATSYVRYICAKCGAWSRGKIMGTSLAVRRAKLTGIGNG